MSSEQYSPLDTTLPFFSNQIRSSINRNDPITIPFLLKFKGIARRVKIIAEAASGNQDIVSIYFDGDLENPTRISGGSSETFNRWVKSVRLTSQDGVNHYVQVQYDIVPVEYLPPKPRRAL